MLLAVLVLVLVLGLLFFIGACCDGGNYDKWIEEVIVKIKETKPCHRPEDQYHQRF